jgi:hypothetical protein
MRLRHHQKGWGRVGMARVYSVSTHLLRVSVRAWRARRRRRRLLRVRQGGDRQQVPMETSQVPKVSITTIERRAPPRRHPEPRRPRCAARTSAPRRDEESRAAVVRDCRHRERPRVVCAAPPAKGCLFIESSSKKKSHTRVSTVFVGNEQSIFLYLPLARSTLPSRAALFCESRDF